MPTSVGSKAVEVACIGKSQGMSLSARDCNDLLIRKRSDFSREWLVGLRVSVFWKVFGVIESKLTIGGFTPCIDYTFVRKSHRMRISASQLDDKLVLKAINLFWHWHKWATIYIEWHCRYVSESELAARASSETINFS